MNKAEKKQRMAQIVAKLESLYPSAECALEYGGEPWRLMVMGRLSAQCTDARVNQVCRELFARFPTLDALADAPLDDIAEIVRPCGLWKTKSENIKAECVMLRDEFGGELPSEMDDLLRFPGVGRKIANLLRGDIFGAPAVVADTHCIRICGRLGMYRESLKDAHKVERTLSELIEPQKQSDFCHRIVWFGREVCTARSPKCADCPIAQLCQRAIKSAEKSKLKVK